MPIPEAILVAIHGHQMIFGFDNDEEEEQIPSAKVEGYAEEIVPHFPTKQFKQHFRMDSATFEDLLQKLHAVTNRNIKVGHPEMKLEKQAMLTLWCLANIESFRSVADRFGVSKSTCWLTLYKTCERILEVNRTYKIICWPSRERSESIREGSRQINGFNGVIWCIDGSHIRIIQPKDHPNSYCNRKNFHSVLLQAVCDNRKLFTDVYAGEPGYIHDSRLFEKSDLSKGIENGTIQFYEQSFILGDLAYKLTRTLIVGFKDNGHLTNQQKQFNKLLNQVRVLIENAFALLKGRFRRLKYMETVKLPLICLLIAAGCILHNICILNGDSADDIIDINEEIQEERNNLNNEPCYIGIGGNQRNRENHLASLKRTEIMNQLVPPNV